MDAKSYNAAIRQVRDGALSPQDSWRFRHRHTSLGVTFDVWFLHPIEELTTTDILEFMLTAAHDEKTTDLKLHFVRESSLDTDGLEQKFVDLMDALWCFGFRPAARVAYLKQGGVGWMRMSIFTKEELPTGEFRVNAPQLNAQRVWYGIN